MKNCLKFEFDFELKHLIQVNIPRQLVQSIVRTSTHYFISRDAETPYKVQYV